METHPTEMIQEENDYEKNLQHLTSTIAGNIGEGDQKTESFFSSAACIYKVPEELRMLNKSAYTPRLIAIGPLHRKEEYLQTPLQHVKMSYTNYLLSRLTTGMDLELAEQTKLKVLKECLAEMKTSIDDAKNCYAAEVTIDEEMMLVDGCFILEFLFRLVHGTLKGQKNADPIFGNKLAGKVVYDLVLLENQIPFFVLEKLFSLIVGEIQNRCHYENRSLTDYVLELFDRLSQADRSSTNVSTSRGKTWCSPSDCVLRVFGNKLENPTTEEGEEEVQSGGNIDHRNTKYYHILHKIHDAYLHRDQTERKKLSFCKLEGLMPSASELAYAGVKFVPGTAKKEFKVNFTEPEGLFWWYHRARFEISPLKIFDSTESLLRNLIAFEQCCPNVSQHVSSYATIMDMLVNSDKDVQVLEEAGVMHNWLGSSKDATDLFNNLGKEIYFGDYYFADAITATQYSKRIWPKNMAHLRRTYFASPWTFIAFCVGFIVFIMTFVQFIRDFH